MDPGITGLFIFLGTIIFVSVPVHFFSRNIFFASFVSGLITSLILVMIDTSDLGYINPFFQIALVTGTALGFVISLGIGFLLNKTKLFSTRR